MPYTPPPPKPAKKGGAKNQYATWATNHGLSKQAAADIYYWAGIYKIDPYYFGAVILAESHGKNLGVNSSGQAMGIAQIALSWADGSHKVPWNPNVTITTKWLSNPANNLRFGAYLLQQAVAEHGYSGAYTQGYNPNDPNRFKAWAQIQKTLPKGWVPGGGAGIQVSAENSIAASGVKQDITDPFVTITNNGKLVKATSKGALKVFGQPLTRSQVLSQWQNINDIYLAYTGRKASGQAVKDILASGKSKYQIIDILSKGPHFVNSPVWKQNAPGYEAVWKGIYGQNSTPDAKAIKYAIVNNLGGDGFASTLRSRADYETSQEFKGNEASLSAVYTKVYGLPDASGSNTIKQATKQGQSPDEFASWLRAAPEYQYSSEFKSRTLGLASALGFVTGQQATLGADLTSRTDPLPQTDPNAKPAGVLGG